MRIRMTKTMPGADDRVTVKSYEKDKSYDVSEELGREFIGAKAAVAAPAKKDGSTGSIGADKD